MQVYEDWEKHRMVMLQQQLDELDKERRIEDIKLIKEDLKTRERLLTFFEHEEQIELNIERKLEEEDAKFGPPLEVEAELEENYVPPEIKKKPMPRNY